VTDTFAVEFLRPGAQSVGAVAAKIAAFLNQATHDIIMTTYDTKISELGSALTQTMRGLDRTGVTVRVVDHDDRERKPDPSQPRPPQAPAEWIDTLGLNVHPIASFMDLMHDKYVVLDVRHIWTGSLNWTDDAFTLQENCIMRLDSPSLAANFMANFEELWTASDVEGTGKVAPAWADLVYAGQPLRARAFFSPGRGRALADEIAAAIRTATRRVMICSPVLTSGPILEALGEVAAAGRVPIVGVVDATQMKQVMQQWADRPVPSPKLEVYNAVANAGAFTGKRSVPWGPGRPHDYMHAKIVVADDTAFAGSFNHSRSGERNAENVLQILGPAAADTFAAFITETHATYARVVAPDDV
jgi:phosphatidylserine/phosphatidylglycerophosphate/cardiolipin synthase-like enzyme